MAQNLKSLSPELIIHPGETLNEVLGDRGMTQKELSGRTGRTRKHINEVINGKKDISNDFAKKLEYALGISSIFWLNLQTNYDDELTEYNDLNNISDTEFNILKKLKDIKQYFIEINKITEESNQSIQIIELRKLLRISSLENIPKLQTDASYRLQENNKVDEYILFAWEKLCEFSIKNFNTEESLNINLLKDKIPEIKNLMHRDFEEIIEELTEIFSECGIEFAAVPYFRGAPVQGFIKRTSEDKLFLCMTNRRKYADIFWFSLFHEIGHILNNHINDKHIDFTDPDLNDYGSKKEQKADDFAKENLISNKLFKQFIEEDDFSEENIIDFANEVNVPPFIVIGRLQKEEYINYGNFEHLKIKYEFE